MRKVVGGFGKKSEKARKHTCITDRRDMTAVKVALNPNTTNQPGRYSVSGAVSWQEAVGGIYHL